MPVQLRISQQSPAFFLAGKGGNQSVFHAAAGVVGARPFRFFTFGHILDRVVIRGPRGAFFGFLFGVFWDFVGLSGTVLGCLGPV